MKKERAFRNYSLKPAIILTGFTAGLGVIRALGQNGVPIILVSTAKKEYARKSKYVKETIFAPDPEKNGSDYIHLLLENSNDFGGSLVIPTSDETLTLISQNLGALKPYYSVACADWEVVGKFLEKKYTSQIALETGVPAPKTIIPKNLTELEDYAQNVQYPCLVKPSQGHLYYSKFNKKMTLVYNPDQMQAAYSEAKAENLEIMIQEFIPGDDDAGANYNSYYWEGEPICEFAAKKIRNAPPVIGSPCALISKDIPEIHEYGRMILKKVNYSGFSCMEFKKDERDGVYKLMEVNARHNLSTSLAVRCGMNFPWLQYQHLMMGGLPPASQSYQKGIYWIDSSRDIAYRLLKKNNQEQRLKDFLNPYCKKHVFAIIDLGDLAPLFLRINDGVRRFIREILKIRMKEGRKK